MKQHAVVFPCAPVAANGTKGAHRALVPRMISETTGSTPTALVAAIQGGSQTALRQLYDLESRRLYGIALRILGRPDQAADAVQETFLQVWQNAAAYMPERGAAAAWLTGIVRYRALDIRRRHSREFLQEMPSEVLSDAALTAEFDARLAHAALRRCLEALDENQRRCVVLAFVEGLSHTDIADRTASPLGTVKSWVRRGLLSLRSCLG